MDSLPFDCPDENELEEEVALAAKTLAAFFTEEDRYKLEEQRRSPSREINNVVHSKKERGRLLTEVNGIQLYHKAPVQTEAEIGLRAPASNVCPAAVVSPQNTTVFCAYIEGGLASVCIMAKT